MSRPLGKMELYVGDDGRVTCHDKDCGCETGEIEITARRVTYDEFTAALRKHWRTHARPE